MQAIILAGGTGMRLRPLTDYASKPMLPVMNRPMLCYVIELLKKHSITDIAVTVCHRADDIREYFGDGSRFGVHLEYFSEDEPLGTAGGAKSAQHFIKGSFLVISGDIISDINLEAAISFHKKMNAKATLLLSSSENPTDCGTVITAEDSRVMYFCDKPDWDEILTDMVSTGIYIFEPDVLPLIPPHGFYDFAKNLFPQMLRLGLPVFGFKADGYWCDIDNLDAYRKCHRDIFSGAVNLGIDKSVLKKGILIGSDCKISDSAELLPYCVLGDGCTIGDNVSLKDCIVWHGAKVENNSRLHSSVISSQLPLSQSQKNGADKFSHNKISGIMHQDITPDFALRLCAAFANSLEKNPAIVLCFPDFPDAMSLKFAMLSGLIASGAKVYNLCGINDRGAARFAVRHLHASGAVVVSLENGKFLAELMESSGAPASKAVLRSTASILENGNISYSSPVKTRLPVNVNNITDYYLNDIMAYTHYKRLNFSIGIATGSQAACEAFKKLGSLLGINFLFTNEASLLPELIKNNRLDFSIEISPDGGCVIIDDSGKRMNRDQYWGLVTLICQSAVHGSSTYVPTDVGETVNIIARALGGSIIRTNPRELEARLLAQNTPVSRLEHALCFDYIRAVVRICEFLYLNDCSLSKVISLMPIMHKISRYVSCPNEKKGQVMRRFIETAQSPLIEADGGASIRSSNGRVLIIPDDKESRIHIIAENKNAQFAAEAAEEFCIKLEKFLK